MKQPRELSEREKWFRQRIGKVIYRNDNGCSCPACQDALKNGLVVNDEMHANYLYENECEYTAEGHPLRYFDTKEEAMEFSVQQQS